MEAQDMFKNLDTDNSGFLEGAEGVDGASCMPGTKCDARMRSGCTLGAELAQRPFVCFRNEVVSGTQNHNILGSPVELCHFHISPALSRGRSHNP